ncbi:gas vesicle protein [Streptomyces camponoticapitis]|uniref:Gas vesicle protein n=1 Tax=Streptomyces camponoticapitis TaxID=1616125 RepID=A0ABQ2E175_9ACTN|nr:GvpL/GvpF family gas vesicle protein [Streptomyces camponoticapitis]GGJ84139.1 gas vesicle protein [Streptomyces camponoticapitis]
MPTYIYAITGADHPLRLDGLKGVGDPPSDLRTVRTGDLGAVVSDTPSDLRAKRRDLVAHQSVLERLMAEGAALPMRFGLVGPDDDQVLAALEQERESYTARLGELDGRLEYNLKVSRPEESLLREILSASGDVRRLSEFTRQNPGAQKEKMALGELVSQEIQVRQGTVGNEITSVLTAEAERVSAGEPTKAHFLNVSFLVKRDEAAAFSQAVYEEAERRGDDYEFTLNGPLPPYSFV